MAGSIAGIVDWRFSSVDGGDLCRAGALRARTAAGIGRSALVGSRFHTLITTQAIACDCGSDVRGVIGGNCCSEVVNSGWKLATGGCRAPTLLACRSKNGSKKETVSHWCWPMWILSRLSASTQTIRSSHHSMAVSLLQRNLLRTGWWRVRLLDVSHRRHGLFFLLEILT